MRGPPYGGWNDYGRGPMKMMRGPRGFPGGPGGYGGFNRYDGRRGGPRGG